LTPIPTETLWEIEPHTRAKHEILRRYLGAWFGIIGRNNPRLIYLDGFCGPGRYQGGEEGSPVIALKLAIAHYGKNNIQEANLIFVEERKDRVDHLSNEIKSLLIPPGIHVSVLHNQFESTLTDILNRIKTQKAKIAPTFAFIDPFGFKGAPYTLVKSLLSNDKTEVFINIMADSINRFLNHPDMQITQHIVDLFGTRKVLEIIQNNGDHIKQLRELYQRQLNACAKYVRYFEMRDDHHRIIYYLFFATNNRLGHIKMKEAFWKLDNSTGMEFSDATDPNQLVLFEVDPTSTIAEELAKIFCKKTVLIKLIRNYIEDKTPYTGSLMKKALILLEEQDRLCVEPCKTSGCKRIKHTFPDDVIVSFTAPIN
jgi:three-Cys-motif partner protein